MISAFVLASAAVKGCCRTKFKLSQNIPISWYTYCYTYRYTWICIWRCVNQVFKFLVYSVNNKCRPLLYVISLWFLLTNVSLLSCKWRNLCLLSMQIETCRSNKFSNEYHFHGRHKQTNRRFIDEILSSFSYKCNLEFKIKLSCIRAFQKFLIYRCVIYHR